MKCPLAASFVLVVEDDDPVRVYAAEMLEDASFTVVEARNVDKAWDILQERSDIGVLFTDIDMPDSMCCVMQAEKVNHALPDIRLVLTASRQRFGDGEVPDKGLFVPKPYDSSQVVHAIHHAV